MQSFLQAIRTIFHVALDAVTFMGLCLRSTTTVAAENLFLRIQLGLFLERKVKLRRATDAIRFTLPRLSDLFDWRAALTIVKPDTLIRWHRQGFHLFWKWKSRSCGRPRVPCPFGRAEYRPGWLFFRDEDTAEVCAADLGLAGDGSFTGSGATKIQSRKRSVENLQSPS